MPTNNMQQAQQSNHSAQPVRCFQMLPLSFFAVVPSNLWSFAKALARREISTNQSKVQARSRSNPHNSTKASCGCSVPSSLRLAMLKFHWPSQKHATRRFNESFINLGNPNSRDLVRKGTKLRGSSASSRFQRTLEHPTSWVRKLKTLRVSMTKPTPWNWISVSCLYSLQQSTLHPPLRKPKTFMTGMEFWRAPSDNPSSMKPSSVVKDLFGKCLMVEGTPMIPRPQRVRDLAGRQLAGSSLKQVAAPPSTGGDKAKRSLWYCKYPKKPKGIPTCLKTF